jgi:Tfp pilus assembly PilM family ATPase
MASNGFVLGLSLTDKLVQAVEIEQDGPSNTLHAIDQWVNTLPAAGSKNGKGTEQFTDYLSVFMKVNRVKAQRVSVALDTSLLFINNVPIENDLSRNDMNEQFNWELSQYFPDTPAREFITDTHLLTKTETLSNMLSVSVKRQDAYAVQSAVAKLGLDLHIVDVDHFAADTALRINYPDTNRKYLAFIGIKEDRLDISMLRNGTIEAYSYSVVGSDQEIVDQIATVSREAKGIHGIIVYGSYLEKNLLVQIRRASSLLVEALNPLRHVKVSDSLRIADHLTAPSYQFASAVGVALRRD